jgi:hypothetical protein
MPFSETYNTPEELDELAGGTVIRRSTGREYRHRVKMHHNVWVPVGGGTSHYTSFQILQTGPAQLVYGGKTRISFEDVQEVAVAHGWLLRSAGDNFYAVNKHHRVEALRDSSGEIFTIKLSESNSYLEIIRLNYAMYDKMEADGHGTVFDILANWLCTYDDRPNTQMQARHAANEIAVLREARNAIGTLLTRTAFGAPAHNLVEAHCALTRALADLMPHRMLTGEQTGRKQLDRVLTAKEVAEELGIDPSFLDDEPRDLG